MLPMKILNLPKLLLHLGILSLLTISFYTPIADAKYRPKRVGRYRGATIPTGTRSACNDAKTPDRLTAIAPVSHIGQTAKSTPTVTWFVPNTPPTPLTLRLWQDDKIIWETTLQSTSGLMSHTLPELKPNQSYRWQLVLICNPKRPSLNQVTQAFILYTPLKTPLSTPPKLPAQVQQLSEAELWYDALDLARTDRKLYSELLTDLKTIETEFLNESLKATTPSNADPQDPEPMETLKQHIANLTHLLSL